MSVDGHRAAEHGSGDAELCDASHRGSSGYVRDYAQFETRDVAKINRVILDLARRASRAEIELLPNGDPVPFASMRRPRDAELLRAGVIGIDDDQPDTADRSGRAEAHGQHLGPGLRCLPLGVGACRKGGGDRVVRGL